MGMILSTIPTEGIGLCIFASIFILILVGLSLKFFGTPEMILSPKKKTNFFNILKDAAKAHSKVTDETSVAKLSNFEESSES